MHEQFQYKIEQDTPSDLCASCIGACCVANTVLELNQQEAAALTDAGTELEPLTKRQVKQFSGGTARTTRGMTHFVLRNDCGNLDPETKHCKDYDNRPQICRDFKAGSFMCGIMRNARMPQAVDLPTPSVKP